MPTKITPKKEAEKETPAAIAAPEAAPQAAIPETEAPAMIEVEVERPILPAKEIAPPAPEIAVESVVPPVKAPLAPAVAPPVEEELAKVVGNILEEDLDVLYRELTPEEQEVIKKKGEETAQKISALLTAAKIKAKKIITLIVAWLRLIPKVNKYFIEQEAKIKTDKILALDKERKR